MPSSRGRGSLVTYLYLIVSLHNREGSTCCKIYPELLSHRKQRMVYQVADMHREGKYIFLSFHVIFCISIICDLTEISHSGQQENCCTAVILFLVPDVNYSSNFKQVPGTCLALIFGVTIIFGCMFFHWWQVDDIIRVCCRDS